MSAGGPPRVDGRRAADALPSPLARLRTVCATLQSWEARREGLDFADERGWLGDAEQDEKRLIGRELEPLRKEGERLWRELPRSHPAAVQRGRLRAV